MKLYLKILNKNLATAGDYTSAKSFVIDEDCILTENYNETLDSFTCHISHLTSELEIEPYDDVLLYDTDNILDDRYFCVDNYIMTQDGIGADNNSFSYDISLFSQTKKLEGVILPNVSITNSVSGYSHSIYHHIKKYLDVYSPKIRINNNGVKTLENRYSLGNITTTDLQVIKTVSESNFTKYGNTNKGISNYEFDISSNIDFNIYVIESLTWSAETMFFGLHANYIKAKCVGFDFKTKKLRFILYTDSILGFYLQVKLTLNFKLVARSSNNKWIKFMDIACPEFQWNAPTLREVLNDLMMVNDCIPIVRNNELSYIDLTVKKNTITNYNYLQKTQSSEDYVSEIRMDLQNTIQTEKTDLKSYTSSIQNETFKCDNYLMSSENFKIITKYPILKIRRLLLTRFEKDENGKNRLYRYNLCNLKGATFVREKQEYDTLPLADSRDLIWNLAKTYYNKYQNYNVYYTRGSNTIEGWQKSTSVLGIDWDLTTYEMIMYIINGSATGDKILSKTLGKHTTVFFEVEYETMTDATFSVSKDEYPSNNKTIIDNQTNSWVNMTAQGNLEAQKVNRLGNQVIMYNQRISPDETPILIGDYKDDNIIYQAQYQIHKNHIECNAYGVNNYILRNYFTGINSKTRTWVNAQDEAFERHDLIKYYCELAFNSREEYTENETYFANYLLSPVLVASETSASPIKYSLIRTTGDNKEQYPQLLYSDYSDDVVEDEPYYGRSISPYTYNNLSYDIKYSPYWSPDLSIRSLNNSLIFTTGFDDNKLTGKYNEAIAPSNATATDKYPSIISDVKLSPGEYADELSEFEDVEINLIDSFSSLSNDINNPIPFNNGTVLTEAQINSVFKYAFRKPRVIKNQCGDFKLNVKKKLYKDNREKIKLSLQYEFINQNKDIYTTKYFIQNEQAIIAIVKPNFNIYLSDKIYYNYKKEGLPSDAVIVDGATITSSQINTMCCKFTIDLGSSQDLSNKALYISDGTNVWLGVKLANHFTTTQTIDLFLNVLKDRDLSLYNNNRIKIGKI